MFRRFFILSAVFGLLLAAAASCSSHGEESSSAPAAGGVALSRRLLSEPSPRGGYAVRLYCTPGEPAVSGTVKLELECEYPSEATLTMPDFPQAQAENWIFRAAVDGTAHLTTPEKYCQTRTFILEPELLDSGDEYAVPGMTVRFTAPDGREIAIATGETRLSIPQPSPEQLAALAIDDTLPPSQHLYSPAERLLRRWPHFLAAALFISGAVAAWRYCHRRKRQSQIPELTAYERAMRELTALLEQRLPEQGAYKEYYTGLSAILRRYIENRFALHAPKLTTEEFLRELARHAETSLQSHRPLLQDFLTACDLVKFAAQIPGRDESARLAESCRQFISQTEPVTAQNAGEETDAKI